MQIRPERPGDKAAISRLTTAAFLTAAHSDGTEAAIIDRLRKSGETASHYSRAQLEHILSVLLGLDAALKSSAADGTVLLQTALCEVMQIGERR